jgi:hypothetical protein
MPETTTETRPGRALTSVMVGHGTHADLSDIKNAMSREASRRVTMDEVITMLIESWETK